MGALINLAVAGPPLRLELVGILAPEGLVTSNGFSDQDTRT